MLVSSNRILEVVYGIFFLAHSFIYELLQKAHVNYDTKTAVVEAMEQITGYLAGSKYGSCNIFLSSISHDLILLTLTHDTLEFRAWYFPKHQRTAESRRYNTGHCHFFVLIIFFVVVVLNFSDIVIDLFSLLSVGVCC